MTSPVALGDTLRTTDLTPRQGPVADREGFSSGHFSLVSRTFPGPSRPPSPTLSPSQSEPQSGRWGLRATYHLGRCTELWKKRERTPVMSVGRKEWNET